MINFEFLARAVIEREGKILLCRSKGESYWFFPGGHVEEGERASEALIREVREEIGALAEVGRFLGASENKYVAKGATIYELNLIFEVTIKESGAVVAQEDHLEFRWFTRGELPTITIMPPSLAGVVDVLDSSVCPFWGSDGFKELT